MFCIALSFRVLITYENHTKQLPLEDDENDSRTEGPEFNDTLLEERNQWMLQKMERVSLPDDITMLLLRSPDTTITILQKLIHNTNCLFVVHSIKHVIEFFTYKHFTLSKQKQLSLSFAWYQNIECPSELKSEQSNICDKVTKLQIDKSQDFRNTVLLVGTLYLFKNVIKLEIRHREFFE